MGLTWSRRGVSEVVATLALLAITLVAMAIYIQGFNLYYSGETGLLSGIFRTSSEQNYERLSIIYAFQNGSGENTALYLVVSNYGARNATIERLVINTNVTSFSPQTIPVGQVSVIMVNFKPPEESVLVISLITERNNVISAQFRV